MNRISPSFALSLVLASVTAIGCGNAKPGTTDRPVQATPVAQARPAPAPRSETMVIPAGTDIMATLESGLSTDINHSGDPFRARVTESVKVDGRTVVPAGSKIHGVLSGVQDSGKIKGRARMTLSFTQIEDSRGQTHAISARPLTLEADSNTSGDVEKIVGGGVLGAIIGGIAGGKKGAVIGAGAGAGAGTIIVLATKGDDIELPAGQSLVVSMTSPTSIVLVAQK